MPPTESNKDKPSILKATREAKGLTLEIVHEATKIPMDALKAIEEGYSSRILSPFYYRGFIKIYAVFLGLDANEMYKEYGLEESTLKPAVPAAQVKSNLGVSKSNVAFEQAQECFSFLFKPKVLKVILKSIGFLVIVVLFFKMAGCVASHLHKKEIPHRQQGYSQSKEERVPGTTNHQIVAAQSTDDNVEVAVRASKDTWLRVKTDDQVVFQATLSKGSLETWTADNHIELSGRDLEQLDMEVNYKQIGFLGGGDRRIKRVLITKEGLTVKK